MKKNKTENFVTTLVSVICMGLCFESILMGWEFWVPPLFLIATLFLWLMNITQIPEFQIRKVYYLVYTMLAVFYYGVHETGYYDETLLIVLLMVGLSFFGHIYMVNLLLAEHLVIVAIQLVLDARSGNLSFEVVDVSRAAIHLAMAAMGYFICIRLINGRTDIHESLTHMESSIEAYDADMEDFLSNISHELRTPVNVVSGMSDLLIKRNAGSEAFSIKDAGIRLAYQIEDIQDYTECKRKKLLLEEDDYMSISLINDVVTSFRMTDNINDLELVVDLSPTVPTMLRGDIRKLHKIFRHLLENAVKFTKRGGIYVKLYTESMQYGVNLVIEMEDTGIGMGREAIESIAEGMYQVNKRRNRSSGGIGLGLYIVHGFAHSMGGFVKIESTKKKGTMVRVTIPQQVVNDTPCLVINDTNSGDILFHVRSDKYDVPRVRDFYRFMAANLAHGIGVPLYSAETIDDIERIREKLNVTYIFMGQEEYEENPKYYDRLSEEDIIVAVSASADFRPNPGSRVMVMPKPLYAYPAIKILNEGRNAKNIEYSENAAKPVLSGVKALVVDDEPMNLVVATSLFTDYEMIIETADSGQDAINKFINDDYDIVFMDHMMPEMDGVEAMKKIKAAAVDLDREIKVVALTANAISGAREMFIEEGFDGFIAKPINTDDFERVMQQVLPHPFAIEGGGAA